MARKTRREELRELAEKEGWQLMPNHPRLESQENVDRFLLIKGTWLRLRYSTTGALVGGAAKLPSMPWSRDLYGRDKVGQAKAFLTHRTDPQQYRIDHN